MKKNSIGFTFCGLIVLLLSCGSNDVKLNQTISFDYLAPHNLSEGSFILKATSSSGLPVTFLSSDTTIATIRDSTIKFIKSGTVEISAVQAGNIKYYAAAKVTRILTVNEDNNAVKNDQAIIRTQDGNNNYFLKREIPYTDLAEGEWKFYVEDGWVGEKEVKVILLPSEH